MNTGLPTNAPILVVVTLAKIGVGGSEEDGFGGQSINVRL
jgi:hypothetical protein